MVIGKSRDFEVQSEVFFYLEEENTGKERKACLHSTRQGSEAPAGSCPFCTSHRAPVLCLPGGKLHLRALFSIQGFVLFSIHELHAEPSFKQSVGESL